MSRGGIGPQVMSKVFSQVPDRGFGCIVCRVTSAGRVGDALF